MPRHRPPEAAREPPFPGRRAVGLAVLAGVGWAWAAGLLATREHDLVHYFVLVSAPRAWGLIGLPLWQLSLVAGLGGGLALGCFRAARLRLGLPASHRLGAGRLRDSAAGRACGWPACRCR